MNLPYITNNEKGWLTVSGIGDFSVFRTFDCGQCFRFDPVQDPTHKTEVGGIAFGKYVRFAENGDGNLYVYSTEEDFNSLWLPYLSLDKDYEEINRRIISSLSGKDRDHITLSAEASRGIRILRQDPWEALCSFIVSQNNNIPRIKKIIASMCEAYGEKIEGGYSFPTPEALVKAGEAAIFDLRTGFRAKYIYDCACKVSSGELSLEKVRNADTYEKAEELLISVKGVGPKVAACALLFGFERLDAFPVDVWIKKVIANRFENGLDHRVFGEYAGVAQQYLFYYERYVGDVAND
ncbi:MAG: DNA glycosylase [Clostridia bacterium]|nr:DNA glycosylase [Clostridia bacterium]